MSGCGRRMVSSDPSKSIICDLPTEILHGILELMPIKYAGRTSTLSKQWSQLWYKLPHLVFDHLFFQYVSNIGDSAARIIRKILMQHTGPILGFHLVSETHKLSQSDVDQCIILVSDHGIQKLTLDVANDELYTLPDNIFTCVALTHLKLSRCIVKFPDGTQFPKLVSLQLEDAAIDRSKQTTLILPMLETLELKFCDDVDYVHIVSLKLVNLSMHSSYAITFQCFNVNPIFRKIKHLCLDGSSLKNLGSVCVLDWLDVSLNLQSLNICDLKISVKRIICALCLLRNSPNLIELDINEVVKVDKTVYHTTELFDYLSKAEKEVSEALKMIRTVRLGKFKGTSTEMYLIQVILAHSPKLERMIIQQKMQKLERCDEILKELISYHRASLNAEIKYS
ncbi:putative F-box/FBD/LRR-repeat protein At4g13965 [Solanum tuberosum]|uniref:Ubiquitin-protein ligase n=1 Tax=Solanum tuberosum TaxID=4113 RepID=M1DHW6_SOLTU|nr:PREDICTED: putative F-box/FBD/LRR-repeat protein At4g13965 [Solanum tuberosum]